MEEFKKILFPVDLSESSPKLVPHVLTMAENFGSELCLVFVARVLKHFTSIYVPHPLIDRFENEVTEGAKKRLQEFKEELLKTALLSIFFLPLPLRLDAFN
jgi:nucleotide-binding universal stress UspA family protein